MRFFILYQNGELVYYKDMKVFKGSIKLGVLSNVRKTAKKEITLTCLRKEKEYVLIQPEGNQVNLVKEKNEFGHISFIDDWIREFNNVIELIKEHEKKNGEVEELDKDAYAEGEEDDTD